MAKQKPATDTPTTANNVSFWVDPNEVNIIEGVEPVDQSQVDALAASFTAHGQKVPVIARVGTGDDKKLEVVAGRHRTLAARQAGTKLWVTVDTTLGDDKTALITTLLENVRRTLSDVEEAKLNLQLMEVHGYSAGDVAELYGKQRDNTARIGQLAKLLDLPQEIQDAVKAGRLSLTAAVGVWGDEEGQQALIAKLNTPPGEKPKRVTAAETGKKPKRNAKHLQDFIDSLETDDETEAADPRVLKLLVTTIKFLKGAVTEKAMKIAVDAFDA